MNSLTANSLPAEVSDEESVVRPGTGRSASVVCCVHRELLSSVFHSQVLVPLSLHAGNVRGEIAAHLPLGHLLRPKWRRLVRRVAKRCADRNIPLSLLPSSPARFSWLINDSRRLVRLVRATCPSERLVLHCRNATMTNIALDAREQLPGARVIFDCRGVEAEERAQRLGRTDLNADTGKMVLAAKRAEARAARDADHLICVSDALRGHLSTKYGVSCDRMTVVPCCLSVDRVAAAVVTRDAVRAQLNIQDRFVLTYCGSLAWYQLPRECLRMVRLMQRVRSDVHFLAITVQPEQMWAEIDRAGFDRSAATVIMVPPDEVSHYLAAGDVGLLLRDDTLVNRVASPVKFGEYMACGLPAVISESVGDYSAAVTRRQLGLTVPLSLTDEELIERLRTFNNQWEHERDEFRHRCQAFATEELSWTVHLPRIANLYHRLSEP